MITSITLNGVASYKKTTTLQTDKRINIIYGLNGSGKTTLSSYLSDRGKPIYKESTIVEDSESEILVYNRDFVQTNFYTSDELKGIFTLSKENKEAEHKIKILRDEIFKHEQEKANNNKNIDELTSEINDKLEKAKKLIWEIKENYVNKDKVLEFCLDGYKNDSKKLFAYIRDLKKTDEKPTVTIEKLKEEVLSISGDDAHPYENLNLLSFNVKDIEENPIFSKVIIGNQSSTVSYFINKLKNSDWVKTGLKYLPEGPLSEDSICPFCQSKTITNELIDNIKNYFDESYESDMKSLDIAKNEYVKKSDINQTKTTCKNHPIGKIFREEIEERYNQLFQTISKNLASITEKIQHPSQPIQLIKSENDVNAINDLLNKINREINIHNINISKKDESFKRIKKSFWEIMRWEYDQVLSMYETERKSLSGRKKILEDSNIALDAEINKKKGQIANEQKRTVNIEESVSNINNILTQLGIDGFKIVPQSGNFYRIEREHCNKDVFTSLSEGEKTIISFLYFLERCKGQLSIASSIAKRIVVIDDPISSLSHIYIFNIGRLIHEEFFRNENYEQIFLLTHSLYFFYEMTYMKKVERDKYQNLFRIHKNSNGSVIIPMKYEEIQNDYHSYWSVIADESNPPALIANCMRNIIEYFFNFVEKQDLNNVFQKPSLKELRFQAFYRYVNRESHSLGQNIFDIKEFNYSDFKEAFALVFRETGYEAHYKKMMGIRRQIE